MNRTPLRAAWAVAPRKFVPRPPRCIATLLGVAVAFCVPAARAQTFTIPANVSSDGAGNAPQMLVDSSGNIDVAYAARTGTNTVGGVRFARSSDGGKTFSKPVDIALSDASDFSMALESDCTIDIAYFQSGDVFFTQSSDCGKTFTPANVTNSNGPPAGSAIEMVVDRGAAQIAWVGGDRKLYYAQRDSHGTFTVPIVLLAQREGSIGLSKMVASNGSTDVVWTAGEFSCQLYFLNSFSGAAPAQVLPQGEDSCGAVPFVVDPAGNVNIAWRDYDLNGSHVIRFVRSVGQTGKFGAPKSISAGLAPQIAAGSDGKIGLAWASGANVMFSGSTDGGNTFSVPVGVTAAPNAFSVSEPQVALHGDSSADIAWGQNSDLWFSQSSDGGSTFSTPVNITRNQSAPSAVRMIADSAGGVLMVWSGTVGNGKDVFFARSTAAGGGFTISAAPALLTGMSGGSATAEVTLTATGGFDQAVNLSCGKLPPGAECSFNPASVTPSNSGTLVTLTLTIPPALPAGGFPFTLSATTTTITQFQTMQFTVGGLTGSVTPATTTIPLGATANFTVTVVGTGSFAGQFNLTCNAPAGVTCAFSPTSAFLPINGRVTSTLTVQILALPSVSAPGNPPDVFPLGLPMAQKVLPIAGLLLLLLSVPAFAFLRRTRGGRLVFVRTAASIFLTAALAAAMLSCGGSTTRNAFGVSTATVGTGSTTSGSVSVTFPLTVLAQSGASVVNVGTVAVTVP